MSQHKLVEAFFLTNAKRSRSSQVEQNALFSIMKNYFKDRLAELNNVTWPTRKQAIHSMIIVLVIMLIVGIFLGVIDSALNRLVLLMIK